MPGGFGDACYTACISQVSNWFIGKSLEERYKDLEPTAGSGVTGCSGPEGIEHG